LWGAGATPKGAAAFVATAAVAAVGAWPVLPPVVPWLLPPLLLLVALVAVARGVACAGRLKRLAGGASKEGAARRGWLPA
jgi:hypothetical protein